MPSKNLYIAEPLYRRYVNVADKRGVDIRVVLTEALKKSIDQLEKLASEESM